MRDNNDERAKRFRAFADFSYETAPAEKVNCFTALRNWKNFSGRARRKEYFLFILLAIAASFVATILDGGTSGSINTLVILFLMIPYLSVTIRRLHDTGHSAWWLLWCFVPLIGNIVLLILMFLDSQPGMNRYGNNPKGIC